VIAIEVYWKIQKKRGNFFQEIAADITEILDDSKERYIVNYLSEGLSNRVLFEKFINFQWLYGFNTLQIHLPGTAEHVLIPFY
jgi:hypothetical protein